MKLFGDFASTTDLLNTKRYGDMMTAGGVMKMMVMVMVMKVVVVESALVSPREHHLTPGADREGRHGLAMNLLECTTSGGKTGSCLPYYTCSAAKAKKDGLCFHNAGHCCLFERTCGGRSRARVTYFTNNSANNDDTESGSICEVQIIKGRNVCQLRVGLDMKLTEPDAEGACTSQHLEIIDVDNAANLPKVCGVNDETHHIVADVKNSAGPFKIRVVNTAANPASNWDIRIEQIKCDSKGLADQGCEQYFLEVEGEVKSFNFGTVPSTNLIEGTVLPGSRHLQESYTICVRPAEGYCSITWSPDASMEGSFISSQPAVDILPPVEGSVPVSPMSIITDFVMIPGATAEGVDIIPPFFHGNEFSQDVTSTDFRIYVVVDKAEIANEDFDNRGFFFKYKQNKC